MDYSRVAPPSEAVVDDVPRVPVERNRGSHAQSQETRSGPDPRSKRYKFGDDSLGKLVSSSVHQLQSSTSWAAYVTSTRGQSHLAPGLEDLPHPASSLLTSLRDTGMPVITGTVGWSDADFDARLQRGSHTSTHDHVDFVRDEMADFARKGFWTVLPYEAVRELSHQPGFRHLRSLRVSPLGCVPQRGRRPRLIVDLSFYGVNADTVKLAPHEAMQFGRALERLLFRIRHANPRYGPVYMNKIDISDGFYRVALAAASCPKLAIVLPTRPGEPTLLAIPLSLPMGWIESPPAFCAVTETVADLANWRLPRRYAPPHRLDKFADTPPPDDEVPEVPPHDVDTSPGPCAPVKAIPSAKVALPSPLACPTPPVAVPRMPAPLPAAAVPSRQPHALPLSYTDVYVDDFCNLVQGNARRRRIARRILFHAIDEVIRPLDPSHDFHQEPISIKKLLKGDGCWGTSKILLGWLIDTAAQTLTLPPHRYERLCAIFDDLRGRKRVSLKTWQQVLGELRSMVLAIPGGRGLFSTLQTGILHSDRNRVRLDSHVRAQLDDFEALAADLHLRPTRLAEIVPDLPSGIGAVDAAKPGMGGVWFVDGAPPLLWRAPFPSHVQARLVSDHNPRGDLSNSDLELAGVVAHQDILAQSIDSRERTFTILNDNSPAVSRASKGSISSRDSAAYLLRLASLHQRHHRYCLRYDHIAGAANAMADDASRLWSFSNSQLLAHFEQHYPQSQPWQLRTLRPPMHSALTSALLRTRVAPQLVLNAPTRTMVPGPFGLPSVAPSTSTPFWRLSQTQSHTYKSLHNDIATAALPKMVSPSDLAQWRTPFVPLARRWPAWGPRTAASSLPRPWTTASANNSPVGVAPIPLRNALPPLLSVFLTTPTS